MSMTPEELREFTDRVARIRAVVKKQSVPEPEPVRELRKKEMAELLLNEAFSEPGELPAIEVIHLAKEYGVKEGTLLNARLKLNIRTRKKENGGWIWFKRPDQKKK